MNFHSRHSEEPMEINLIPLIDVLLVILIFLAASTSFTQQRQLQLDLPQAKAQAITDEKFVSLSISKEGIYLLNGDFIDSKNSTEIAKALRSAITDDNQVLRIEADNLASHGSVVTALEAARLANIEKIQFITQTMP